MNENVIRNQLNARLDENYEAYLRDLGTLDSRQLIERVEEVSASKLVYGELKDGRFNVDYLEYLLRFENPLAVVRDQWLDEQNMPHDEEMEHVLWNIYDKGNAEQAYEMAVSEAEPRQDGGVKMC